MKFTFILPHINISGGVRFIFELSNTLIDSGHEVNIVTPTIWRDKEIFSKGILSNISNIPRILKSLWEHKRNSSTLDWFDLKANCIKVPNLLAHNIPNANWIVATAFDTAYWVNSYSDKKGRKAYLILGYELWGDKEKIHRSWHFSMTRLACTSWLKEIVEKETGRPVSGVFFDGVNLKKFYPDYALLNKCKEPRWLRVGFVYRPYYAKGRYEAIRAFEIARYFYPKLKLVCFGGTSKPKEGELPDCAEFYYKASENELRRIYSSCGTWMIPTWNEAGGCVLIEAMACGCAVIATETNGNLDVLIPNKIALLSPVRDVQSMARNIISLLDDKKKMEDFGKAGLERAQDFTFDKIAAIILETIKRKASKN